MLLRREVRNAPNLPARLLAATLIFEAVTINLPGPDADGDTDVPAPEVRNVLRACSDMIALMEPAQAQLWHSVGLTLTHLVVLRQLQDGPLPAGKLGQAVGRSAASMTHLLDRMEERGLVSRRRDTGDRRCVEVHIEPMGQQVLGRRVVRRTPLRRAVESMSPERRQQLLEALTHLAERTRAFVDEAETAEPAQVAPR